MGLLVEPGVRAALDEFERGTGWSGAVRCGGVTVHMVLSMQAHVVSHVRVSRTP